MAIFGQIKIGSDSSCSGNPCSLQHIQDHFTGKITGGSAGSRQIISEINKYLINGIDMDIFRGNVF